MFFLRHNYLCVNVDWSNIEKFACHISYIIHPKILHFLRSGIAGSRTFRYPHISLISDFDVLLISRIRCEKCFDPCCLHPFCFDTVLGLSYFSFMESFVIGIYITDPKVDILGQIKLTLVKKKIIKFMKNIRPCEWSSAVK